MALTRVRLPMNAIINISKTNVLGWKVLNCLLIILKWQYQETGRDHLIWFKNLPNVFIKSARILDVPDRKSFEI